MYVVYLFFVQAKTGIFEMSWKFWTFGFGFTLLPYLILYQENVHNSKMEIMILSTIISLLEIIYQKIEIFLCNINKYLSTWSSKSSKKRSSMLNQFRLIKPISEIDKLLYKHGTNECRKGFVEFGKNNIVMPSNYVNIADKIENFKVRDTDVWIVTHPKTGTTWTQEMMWMIINNMDYEGAKKRIQERFTFLEFEGLFDIPLQSFFNKLGDFIHPKYIPQVFATIQRANHDERTPRLIKTHLPWCLLPRAIREQTTKAKIVYVVRNPKDTCASFYYHQRLLDGFTGSFEEFCRLFLAGKIYYGPYWNSVLDFWKRRNDSNICIIKFEDMKKDLEPVIRRVSQFLINRQLTDEQIADLKIHLSFEKMKNNPAVNYENDINHLKFFKRDRKGTFMRCGKVGSYKNDMTPEVEKLFDEWIESNTRGFDENFVRFVNNC